MFAASATSAFHRLTPLPFDSGSRKNLDGCGFKPKLPLSSRLQVRTTAQASPKINGSSAGLSFAKDCVKTNEEIASPPSRTSINQLPDWSKLLAAIAAILLDPEKQWTMLGCKPRCPDMLIDPFGVGGFVQDGFVFRQNFSIRSYEIGADRTASIGTLMNHLQETALNHCKTAGLLGDGFGATPEMCRRNLIWVVTRMQVLVDSYPTWGDVVQIDTWSSPSGKNGMRRDWLVHDCKTNEILARASSVWAMMNKYTRKLSKMPDEVRTEMGPYFGEAPPVIDEDGRKLAKLNDSSAEYIMSGLTPRWTDLDINQHVNNVKYIGWILESAPLSIVENHMLSGMTLEYRRECGRDSIMQSLTAVAGGDDGGLQDSGHIECEHLLRFQDGAAEVLRARTEWRPKHTKNGELGQIPVDGA